MSDLENLIELIRSVVDVEPRPWPQEAREVRAESQRAKGRLRAGVDSYELPRMQESLP